MTDFEVLQRAKRYIDDLANGVDPITGAELPEDTALNNVRLARCFFYVAGVLQKVIDNGGEVGAKPSRPKKAAFSITRQEIDTVPVTETPTYISHFCRAISDAARTEEKGVRALSHRVVTDWLIQKGFLEIDEGSGKKIKRVTSLGAEVGLCEVERDGPGGRYLAITYSQAAQQFVLDNLEAILGGAAEG